MNQQEFIEKYGYDIPILNAWGSYVKNQIDDILVDQGRELKKFLKIQNEPRVKEVNSLIEKAFLRGKDYKNPYDDITDKIGIRYVVLLENEVDEICDIVESKSDWKFSKDKDYEVERKEKPELFEYKSMHYIVRSLRDFDFNGITIKKDTACEIQIRTLLQHAYAELSHDQIYKNKSKIDGEVRRMISRSMALIEATDGFFMEASKMINSNNKKYGLLIDELAKIYSKYIGTAEIMTKINITLIDELDGLVEKIDIENDLSKFIEDSSNIKKSITDECDKDVLFKQPVVLLLYYFLKNNKNELLDKWDSEPKFLRPISNYLGINIEQNY